MALCKQAKILNDKQHNLVLAYLNGTRYSLRNKLIYLLSFKAGLRAKEISSIFWQMVCGADGNLGKVINFNNQVSILKIILLTSISIIIYFSCIKSWGFLNCFIFFMQYPLQLFLCSLKVSIRL